jgi:replicative DNA helicase
VLQLVTGRRRLAPCEYEYNQVPHNIEAEQALLGAIYFNNKALDLVPFLKSEHFYDRLHQKVYRIQRELIGAG